MTNSELICKNFCKQTHHQLTLDVIYYVSTSTNLRFTYKLSLLLQKMFQHLVNNKQSPILQSEHQRHSAITATCCQCVTIHYFSYHFFVLYQVTTNLEFTLYIVHAFNLCHHFPRFKISFKGFKERYSLNCTVICYICILLLDVVRLLQ